jgi:hypothetical protein
MLLKILKEDLKKDLKPATKLSNFFQQTTRIQKMISEVFFLLVTIVSTSKSDVCPHNNDSRTRNTVKAMCVKVWFIKYARASRVLKNIQYTQGKIHGSKDIFKGISYVAVGLLSSDDHDKENKSAFKLPGVLGRNTTQHTHTHTHNIYNNTHQNTKSRTHKHARKLTRTHSQRERETDRERERVKERVKETEWENWEREHRHCRHCRPLMQKQQLISRKLATSDTPNAFSIPPACPPSLPTNHFLSPCFLSYGTMRVLLVFLVDVPFALVRVAIWVIVCV